MEYHFIPLDWRPLILLSSNSLSSSACRIRLSNVCMFARSLTVGRLCRPTWLSLESVRVRSAGSIVCLSAAVGIGIGGLIAYKLYCRYHSDSGGSGDSQLTHSAQYSRQGGAGYCYYCCCCCGACQSRDSHVAVNNSPATANGSCGNGAAGAPSNVQESRQGNDCGEALKVAASQQQQQQQNHRLANNGCGSALASENQLVAMGNSHAGLRASFTNRRLQKKQQQQSEDVIEMRRLQSAVGAGDSDSCRTLSASSAAACLVDESRRLLAPVGDDTDDVAVGASDLSLVTGLEALNDNAGASPAADISGCRNVSWSSSGTSSLLRDANSGSLITRQHQQQQSQLSRKPDPEAPAAVSSRSPNHQPPQQPQLQQHLPSYVTERNEALFSRVLRIYARAHGEAATPAPPPTGTGEEDEDNDDSELSLAAEFARQRDAIAAAKPQRRRRQRSSAAAEADEADDAAEDADTDDPDAEDFMMGLFDDEVSREQLLSSLRHGESLFSSELSGDYRIMEDSGVDLLPSASSVGGGGGGDCLGLSSTDAAAISAAGSSPIHQQLHLHQGGQSRTLALLDRLAESAAAVAREAAAELGDCELLSERSRSLGEAVASTERRLLEARKSWEEVQAAQLLAGARMTHSSSFGLDLDLSSGDWSLYDEALQERIGQIFCKAGLSSILANECQAASGSDGASSDQPANQLPPPSSAAQIPMNIGQLEGLADFLKSYPPVCHGNRDGQASVLAALRLSATCSSSSAEVFVRRVHGDAPSSCSAELLLLPSSLSPVPAYSPLPQSASGAAACRLRHLRRAAMFGFFLRARRLPVECETWLQALDSALTSHPHCWPSPITDDLRVALSTNLRSLFTRLSSVRAEPGSLFREWETLQVFNGSRGDADILDAIDSLLTVARIRDNKDLQHLLPGGDSLSSLVDKDLPLLARILGARIRVLQLAAPTSSLAPAYSPVLTVFDPASEEACVAANPDAAASLASLVELTLIVDSVDSANACCAILLG